MGSFGDIYLFRKHARSGIAGHYGVLLYANSSQNEVYYQTLTSRIYKVFPNFGTFANERCITCAVNPKFSDWSKTNKRGVYLDVDTVTFLNFKKYQKFLCKETFLCMQRVEKDSYFDFDSKIRDGSYILKGNLLKQNKRSILTTSDVSGQISAAERAAILSFYT